MNIIGIVGIQMDEPIPQSAGPPLLRQCRPRRGPVRRRRDRVPQNDECERQRRDNRRMKKSSHVVHPCLVSNLRITGFLRVGVRHALGFSRAGGRGDRREEIRFEASRGSSIESTRRSARIGDRNRRTAPRRQNNSLIASPRVRKSAIRNRSFASFASSPPLIVDLGQRRLRQTRPIDDKSVRRGST